MAAGFPVKENYANGDVLTATNLNDLAGTVNFAVSPTPTTGTQMAGKNKIINGDFAINQRQFSSITSDGFGFDRWSFVLSGATATYSKESFTPGSAPVVGYESTNFARLTVTTGNDFCRLEQKIEDVRTFANQTVTLSFWAKGTNPTTDGKLYALIAQNFGSGGSTSVLLTAQSYVLTANWTRYSLTFSVPSISGKTIGTGSSLIVRFGQEASASTDAWTLDLWGVQLEAGSVATAFQTATGILQGELAACQRYYVRYSADASNPLQSYGYGVARATTFAFQTLSLPVEMRIAPTAIEYGGNLELWDGVNAATATTTLALDAVSSKYVRYTSNTASGLTQYRPYTLRAANTASAYVGFTSEL